MNAKTPNTITASRRDSTMAAIISTGARRPRLCDLGYLRQPYARTNGQVGYRCPAEPEHMYVRKAGEAAGVAHDRQGAVAHGVHLGQAAGLEARGHEDRVRPCLHEVRERLVIAQHHSDAALVALGAS